MTVHKTTVYLSDDLRSAVSAVARRRGVSEASVIRDAIRAAVADERPAPTPGLFSSDVLMARDVDIHLKGFGER
jgi:metal-responsive CopG/Arc/MetJ family transcriptional regulator